ncbi:MAG: DUF5686 family protein [Thermonemataceae bacterium]
MSRTRIRKYSQLLFLLLLPLSSLYAQQIQIKGRVTDTETGEPIPFANIFFKNHTSVGTSTDVDGYYTLQTEWNNDSLQVTYLSYQTAAKFPSQQLLQIIDFQLTPDTQTLDEVVIRPSENPAFRIIREAVKHKAQNDKRSLEAFQYNSYNRIEGYMSSTEKGISRLKVMKDMKKVAEEMPALQDEEGKTMIPILVSESVSEAYFLGKPQKDREVIQATNLEGIGLEDAQGLGQILTGGQLNEYNFYKNQVYILDKYFISPIADGWRFTYDFDLTDSLYIGNDWCYQLNIVPRNDQDLAFVGTIWITSTDYALKKVDVAISDNANINFVEGLRVMQQMARTSAGAWLPSLVEFEVKLSEFTELIPSITARCKTINSDFVINQPKPGAFYDVVAPPDAKEIKATDYWQEYRTDTTASINQIDIYAFIDTLKTIRSVKSYTKIIEILSTGYYTPGNAKVEFGHYIGTYAWNDIEGHRIGLGMRTNYRFSDRWRFQLQGAYGTRDERFKYSTELQYIISNKKFTKIGVKRTEDVDPLIQLNLTDNDLPAFFIASNRFFDLSERRPFLRKENVVWLESQLKPSFKQKITLQQRNLIPLYNFAYFEGNNETQTFSEITTSEIILQSTFNKGGRRVRLRNNDQVTLGGATKPKVTLTGVFGIKGFLDGQFNYQKLFLDITQRNARIFSVGHANYSLRAGYIFSEVPYPLLKVHLGNNTPVLIEKAFNQMNGFEFVSDHYIALNYSHYFDGVVFNRVPLLRKLDWRLVGTFNILYGGLREENFALIPEEDAVGNPLEPVGRLRSDTPYAEVGYGIDNIFKIFRVDFFHRLTYLDSPLAQPFGVKVSAELKF